jgi:hypothetical protein
MRPSAQSPTTPTPLTTPVQVAPSRAFKPSLIGKAPMITEFIEVMRGPGDTLNLNSGKKFRMIRDQLDANVPYVGLNRDAAGKVKATDIPNPNSPDGSWDPYEFMPRFVYDQREDALPVSPTFDGDTDIQNNAGATGVTKGSYIDGSVGGKQALSNGFSVTKKGEYTILTYSSYYAHNKAMDYHQNDYSTAQVYLKPGPSGKLEPSHLMTSWHHGAVLTPWKDLAKDADGRPVVKVQLGSHALQAIGKGDSWDTDGLTITGKGEALVNGKPIGQRAGFEVFQKNVRNATYMDPALATSAPRLNAMTWGDAAMNPLLPELFDNSENPYLQVIKRLGGPIVEKVKHVGEDLADTAKDAVQSAAKNVAGGATSLAKKAFGLFK